tara:strand:+ start:62 stop:1318 length:1257 start_codon:yes stop_codon:yes gene_type:complete
LIYGLGVTGKSVIRYFKKKKIINFSTWDDNISLQDKNKIVSKKLLLKKINYFDYIIVSPGINLKSQIPKKILKKMKSKILTDLDLFFLENELFKTIIITGTNGKSTTCKIMEHVLKQHKKKVNLCGNIGIPILDQKISNNSYVIIEASSFQLHYSKFLRADVSMILNLTKDHIDWHSNFKNYKDAKFNIFTNQDKNNYALLSSKDLIKDFKSKKLKSKLIKVNFSNIKKFSFKNNYLNSKINKENLSFVYETMRILKLNPNKFIKSLDNFKGLQHRQEFFLKKGNVKFINDSKATSFASTKNALISFKNIYWIVGGKPKTSEAFSLRKFKKNILKAYIIGKYVNFFRDKLISQVKFKVSRNMKNAIKDILKDLQNEKVHKNYTILLSPASASYDQYKNFEERGKFFKKIARFYARKFI